jgi:hypothetical protein
MFSNQSFQILSAPELLDVNTTIIKWLSLQNGGSSVSDISDTDKANFLNFMTTPSVDRKLFLATLIGDVVSVTNFFSRQQYV